MGWYSYHIAPSEINLNDLLNELGEKIQNAEANEDGSVTIEISVKGKTEDKLTFEVGNPKEVVDLIKLNVK